jgi:small basic protein (TIGR04137 family)
MSIDRSLKMADALSRHRNVLSRDERVLRLMDEGSWSEENGITGLPKVSNRKAVAGAKKKKEE